MTWANDEYDDDGRFARLRAYAGWPCPIYVRISQAEASAIKRASKAETEAERQAALHDKVERHRRECADLAAAVGLAVEGEYVEDNISASTARGMLGGKLKPLPRRDALLADLASREHDVVVLTTEVSRLYRSTREGDELIDQGTRMNTLTRAAHLVVAEVSGKPYDLSTGQGRDEFGAKVLAAQAEATSIQDRRLRKERERARAGLYFGRRPFGYDLVRDPATETFGGLLAIREAEAALIRAAAERIITEAADDPERSPSCGAIAREWTGAGVTTTRGGRWTGGTVALLLQRPVLAGWRFHRPGTADGRPPKDRPPRRYRGQWPAILDQATFDQVGVILSDPRRRLNLGDNRLVTALSGLAWCGAPGCGARLRGAPMRPGRKDRRLRCPAKPDGCGSVMRAVTGVEDWVRATVLWWIGDGGQYAASRASLAASGGAAEAAALAADLSRQIAAVEAEAATWVAEMAVPGTTDAQRARFRDVCSRLDATRAALEAERATAQRKAAAASPPPREPTAGEVSRAWDGWTAAERRDWFRRHVAKVIIRPRRPGVPPQWFDPETVEVIPGPWWTGTATRATRRTTRRTARRRPRRGRVTSRRKAATGRMRATGCAACTTGAAGRPPAPVTRMCGTDPLPRTGAAPPLVPRPGRAICPAAAAPTRRTACATATASGRRPPPAPATRTCGTAARSRRAVPAAVVRHSRDVPARARLA